jgi:hypothetical protein
LSPETHSYSILARNIRGEGWIGTSALCKTVKMSRQDSRDLSKGKLAKLAPRTLALSNNYITKNIY